MLVRKVLVSAVLFVLVVALEACSSGGGSAGGNTGDFCTTLRADAVQFEKLGSQANDQQIAAGLSELDRLANNAPAEIKPDMVALVAAIRATSSYASALSADPAAAQSLASQFSSQGAALKTASANVTKFAKDRCGFDLNSSSSSKFNTVANSIN